MDDRARGESMLGACEDFQMYKAEATLFCPAFGNNKLHLEWMDRLETAGCRVPVLIHDTAYVSPEAEICMGIVVLPNAVVNADCAINRGCIINCGVI